MIHLKRTEEVAALRASARLVGETLAEVARAVRPGATTAALDEIAEAYIRSRGARPAFKDYGSRRNPFPATLCISINDVVVHGIPGAQTLEEGDIVSVDCGVELNGYYGDSAYTFAVGEVSEEKMQLCRVTYEALQRGVQAAVAGARVGDVSYAVQSWCEGHGYGVVRDLVGHGIGRELHEPPQVPNYGRRGAGKQLKSGMCLCIEPMINMGVWEVRQDADGWTIRTADGKPAAHYEHMVLVQSGAPEVLSSFDAIEEVVDAGFKTNMMHGQTTSH